MSLNLQEIWDDHMELLIPGALVLLLLLFLVFLAYLFIAEANYMGIHHCTLTGRERNGPLVLVGNIAYPTYEKEYACDGGEHRWN